MEKGMYIIDATHFKDAITDPTTPKPAKQMARFIYALIDAERKGPKDINIHSKVPCMAGPGRKWCLGLIKLSRDGEPPEILWECPECGKAGVIRNF